MVELVGDGALKMAYDKLKAKLEAEGLFAETRKRKIPEYPQKIGVITSKSGAVINDFLTNIGKFGYEILFVDSKVEGQDAVKDLLQALETLKKKEIDVLVMMRGGGSLESFQAFNNEVLVRAVAAFPVPVLTGIGHEKDEPLVALVSDKKVSTPTAVANLLNRSWIEALSTVRLSEEKIITQFQSVLEKFKFAERTMVQSTTRIQSEILRISDKITNSAKGLVSGFENIKNLVNESLSQSLKTIEMGNPERQLSQGYSIVKSKGKIIRRVKDVGKGDELNVMVSDGIIQSEVL
jgi:exodeoxyribonuclease VII large subunit